MCSHVFPCPLPHPLCQIPPGPGYPFLGNDFYRECGDVFASHAMDNPEVASEVELLRSYGPHVPQDGDLGSQGLNALNDLGVALILGNLQMNQIGVGDGSVLWG